ncbi:MAG: MBL fold metallo-hydrolase [Opitutaceae bacterium]|nr:MBL fold metallo-hydrolase [Opitutaceae bacterium]
MCSLCLLALFAVASPAATLPPWSEGHLDIHHINTGFGESAFYILPDGTSLLVDAGVSNAKRPWRAEARPDASRSAGEYLARYILRALDGAPAKTIHYAMLSHFHEDHMGAVNKKTPDSRTGPYKASGITEIPDFVPIAKIIDGLYPDYDGPGGPWHDPKMNNYEKFLKWQMKNKGLAAERFKVGVNNQIVLLNAPQKYPGFEIRNLAARGVVWTGKDGQTRDVFAGVPDNQKRENKSSIAFRLTYGKFKWFTGGDLDCRGVDTIPDLTPDIETAVAEICGHVDAMKANHHGNYDANSVALLRLLSPRAIVIDTWGASQPCMNIWRRLKDKSVWPGPRDIFATNVMPATALALHDEAAEVHSHVVIRVAPGGDSYTIYRVRDTDEKGVIETATGPISCGQ